MIPRVYKTIILMFIILMLLITPVMNGSASSINDEIFLVLRGGVGYHFIVINQKDYEVKGYFNVTTNSGEVLEKGRFFVPPNGLFRYHGGTLSIIPSPFNVIIANLTVDGKMLTRTGLKLFILVIFIPIIDGSE